MPARVVVERYWVVYGTPPQGGVITPPHGSVFVLIFIVLQGSQRGSRRLGGDRSRPVT